MGITPDHTGLVLSEHPRSKRGDLVLEIDDRLLDAVEKAQRLRARDESHGLESAALPTKRDPGPGDGTPGTRLSPREIQQRLRMGETVASLARSSGVDEDWIERFAAPVMAEKVRLVEKARGLTFHRPKDGPSGVTLGPAVAANVIDKGVALTLPDLESGWGAFMRPEGGWCVSFSFPYRGRRQTAEWDLDLKTGELVARNKLAADLGYREPGKKLPQPAPAPVASVVAAAAPSARSASARARASVVDAPEADARPDPVGENREGASGLDARDHGGSAQDEVTIPRGLIVSLRPSPATSPTGATGEEANGRPHRLPPGAVGPVTMARRPGPAPVASPRSSVKSDTPGPGAAEASSVPAPAPARKSSAKPPAGQETAVKAAPAPAKKAPGKGKAALARKLAAKPAAGKAASARKAEAVRKASAKKLAAPPFEPGPAETPVPAAPDENVTSSEAPRTESRDPAPPAAASPVEGPAPGTPGESDPTGPVSPATRFGPAPVKQPSSPSSAPDVSSASSPSELSSGPERSSPSSEPTSASESSSPSEPSSSPPAE